MIASEIKDLYQSLATAEAMMNRVEWLIRTDTSNPIRQVKYRDRIRAIVNEMILLRANEFVNDFGPFENPMPYIDQALAMWGRSPYTGCGAIENEPLDSLVAITQKRIREEQWAGPGLQVGYSMGPLRRDKPQCATCEYKDRMPPVCNGQYEKDPCEAYRKEQKRILLP